MPKTKKRSPIDEFISLPDAEKERITAQFDREFVPTRPLNAQQRRQWQRFKRKNARPTRSFCDMTTAQKNAFVAKLEKGISLRKLKPLLARDRALWEAARRGPETLASDRRPSLKRG